MSGFFMQDSRGLVGENLMWWSKDDNGYTSDIRKAQVYTQEAAQRQHDSRPSDIPWPDRYVQDHARLVVDMQHLGSTQLCSSGHQCYAQIAGSWVGNDCFWLTASDLATTNLKDAAIFTEQQEGYVFWSKPHIEEIARPAVHHLAVNLEEALDGTGITVQKQKKMRKSALRCESCGVFMSEVQFWAGECPNCSADSRP